MSFLGIDIAKKKFDAALRLPSGNYVESEFSNDESGFKKLVKWLRRHAKTNPVAWVVMEATNIYWEDVATHLHTQGYQVSVVNPLVIKGFGQSHLMREKTDKVDSRLIAEFAKEREAKLKAWQPPLPHYRALRALSRHYDQLIRTRTQQKNRLAATKDSAVQQSLRKLIDFLNHQIEEVKSQVATLLKTHPDLKQNDEFLESIKGIGQTTAMVLLAEFYDLQQYESAAKVAADAGITPSRHQSGSSVKRRPKMSRLGKATIRGRLYMPTLAAIRSNPTIRSFAERLRERGKPEKVIIIACMRKLLHMIYGVIKNQRPFMTNPHTVSAKQLVLLDHEKTT